MLAAAAVASGAASGAAHANICASLGLTAGAAIRADGILHEVADEQGRPECVLNTKKGRAYITVFPPSAAAAVKKSWGFDLVFTTEPLAGLGPGAVCLYTQGHAAEALGFTRGGRFVWLATAGRFMHPTLLALAASIYAKI